MKPSERLIAFMPWAGASALLALIVHIVSVLLTPVIAPRAALARLKAVEVVQGLSDKGVLLLPQPAPGEQALPFEDPTVALGACFFDLDRGVLRLRAVVDGDDFFGVSLHQPSGVVFQAVNDRAASGGAIEIVVGDARQIDELEAQDVEGAEKREVRVTAPSRRGFALIRAFAKRPSEYASAQALVAAARCETAQP